MRILKNKKEVALYVFIRIFSSAIFVKPEFCE